MDIKMGEIIESSVRCRYVIIGKDGNCDQEGY